MLLLHRECKIFQKRRYLADLVLTYMQDVLAATVMGSGHKGHGSSGGETALPPPMFPGNAGVPAAMCVHPGHDFKLLVTEKEVGGSPFPSCPPLCCSVTSFCT